MLDTEHFDTVFSVVLGIIAGTFFSVGIVYLFGKKKRGAFVTF